MTIAVVDAVEPELAQESDQFYQIKITKLGSILKTLQREGVTEATMLGKVTKEILYGNLGIPDWRALQFLRRAPIRDA